ncbi:BTB/POZ domain-containing protein [Ditylenchus destructor]|uniref:BTB/POZ domain-containing protein n=1 Tax=Ditylenchus destructor TaxID=166010 RepID=A0AAD4QZM6_9BILA|nr:BTB/POZ domain-containing protein [Ditylenchus destructor]
MNGNDSTSTNKWICLNVGGKMFHTTKDTLLRHPGSFLAHLVDSDLPSDTDETGAYLIDRDPEHFRTILNYLRSPVLNLDGHKKVMKELLCEADFYNIQPLVSDIRKAMKNPVHRTEVIILSRFLGIKMGTDYNSAYIIVSEIQDDYEVLQALRQRITLNKSTSPTDKTKYFIKDLSQQSWILIEAVLRSYGFVEESGSDKYGKDVWKYVRTVHE